MSWMSSSSEGSSLARFVQAGARAWDCSEKWIWVILLLPLAIAFGGAASALLGKGAYKFVTGEDHLAEWLQVVFYTLALAYGLFVVSRLWRSGRHGMAALYIVVVLGLFFMLGEELSWGQRLVGWATPESLREINKQEETNIHNIQNVGSMFKWFQLLVGAYGTILPLWLWRSRRLQRHLGTLRWLIPHPTLIPCFALLMVWRLFRNLFEVPDRFYFVVSEYNEVLELALALGFFLFMLFQLRTLQREQLGSAATPSTWIPAGGEPAHP